MEGYVEVVLLRIDTVATGTHQARKQWQPKIRRQLAAQVMLLTMNDGTQVVVKVPIPNAGKPHFTTASEVATYGFCTFHLKLYCMHLTTKERQALEADVEGVVRGMDAMRSIKESIGELFPEQGTVRADHYEEALDALAQMKDQVIEQFASTEQEKEVWLKEWPFGS